LQAVLGEGFVAWRGSSNSGRPCIRLQPLGFLDGSGCRAQRRGGFVLALRFFFGYRGKEALGRTGWVALRSIPAFLDKGRVTDGFLAVDQVRDNLTTTDVLSPLQSRPPFPSIWIILDSTRRMSSYLQFPNIVRVGSTGFWPRDYCKKKRTTRFCPITHHGRVFFAPVYRRS